MGLAPVNTNVRRMDTSSNLSHSATLLGMPPPYFPAASLAVMLLLATIAAVPPFAVHCYRRHGLYSARHKLLFAVGGVAWAILTLPELVRLASFPGAVEYWGYYATFVFAVSAVTTAVAVLASAGRRPTSKDVGREPR